MRAELVSFSRGAPSLDLIDVDGLAASAAAAFARDPGGTTAYGTAVGYLPLRGWIAEQHHVDPLQVMVTNGSLQADSLLFDELAAGARVAVEDPTYDRTLLGLHSRGARLVGLPLEADGLSVAALDQELRTGGPLALAHVIPNFHNPAGCTLSAHKRVELLERARQHRFVVFEDDPYIHLRFRGETLPRLLDLDGDDLVVYASSFSKTVCPGIRVGYLVGPAGLISALASRATQAYLSPNMVAQSIVYDFCVSGRLQASIERVKTGLADRLEATVNALSKYLPEASFVVPDGGYFLWVTLPEDVPVRGLLAAAAEHGVSFVAGADFTVSRPTNSLRLAFSGVGPSDIEEGIRRLAATAASQTGR